MMKPPLTRSSYLAIAIFHGAALMLQLLLTRVFAITVFYHFAFLVISMVMLGLSAAGLTVHLMAGRLKAERSSVHLTAIALATSFATLIVLFIYLRCDLSFTEFFEKGTPETEALRYQQGLARIQLFGKLILLLFIPQFLIGLVSSLLFHHHPEKAGKIYCADLIGAGIGCVLMVQGSKYFSAFELITITVALMALAGVLFAAKGSNAQSLAVAGTAVMLAACVAQFTQPFLKITHNKLGVHSPEEQVVVERWNPISRVTVFQRTNFGYSPLGQDSNELGQPGFKIEGYWIDQDSCAGTPIFPWSGTDQEVLHLRNTLSGYAYQLAPREKVFVIGVGGGKDLMTALAFGAETVHAAEINPSMAAVLQEDFPVFSGDLYNHPQIDIRIDEGRSSLLARDDLYDQIQLTFIDSFTPTLAGLSAMVENHLYTTEAFDTYFDRLTDDGVLSVMWWNTEEMPAILARLYLTGCEVLSERGIEDPTQNILFVTEKAFIHGILIFREKPFTAEEVAEARQAAEDLGLTIRALPGEVPEQEFIRGMVEAVQPGGDLEAHLETLPIDIRPVTDDRPYIHFIHRADLLGKDEMEARVPKELHLYFLAPRMISQLFWMISGLCLVLVIGPLALIVTRKIHTVSGGISSGQLLAAVLYFVGLGAGFLLVEIALIHRFIVYLGHPLYATSVVLATLLIASGVGGGLLVHRDAAPEVRRRRLLMHLGAIVGLVLVALVAMHPIFEITRPYPLPVRMLVSVAITTLFGLLMGTAFPMALEMMHEQRPKITPTLSPWLWAINGAAGTFASVASILISVRWGFTVCLALGGACYVVCLVTSSLFLKPRA